MEYGNIPQNRERIYIVGFKTKQGIRKMTPKECFNTQGFPESFVLPDIADGRLYKQAGNSVCVSVVQRIAEQMLVAMK